ncbi:hypothetical protein CGCSCA5_v003891 [Colletotrichum siamense]|nr:hypothetical protein CGCSCA5_v003891 [Colletotrichum siamense]
MPRKLRCAAMAWKSPSSQGVPSIARRAAKCRQGSSHFQLSRSKVAPHPVQSVPASWGPPKKKRGPRVQPVPFVVCLPLPCPSHRSLPSLPAGIQHFNNNTANQNAPFSLNFPNSFGRRMTEVSIPLPIIPHSTHHH